VNCHADWLALGDRFGWYEYTSALVRGNFEPLCFGGPYDGNEVLEAPNFEAIARAYDAIAVSVRGGMGDRGVGRRRLQGWHVESACWFRWAAFERAEEIAVAGYRIRGFPIRDEADLVTTFKRIKLERQFAVEDADWLANLAYKLANPTGRFGA
jgi:hypothetical protein